MRPVWVTVADVDATSILFICVALVAIVVAGAWGVLAIRKRMWGDEEDTGAGPDGFSLSDLRELKKGGHISDEEFEKAKARVVAAAQVRMKESGGKPKEAGKG